MSVQSYWRCSMKNFVFLSGALIDLIVRVDTYFHPIKMTYPIHPGPFFRAAPNWGTAAKHSLPQKLPNWTDVLMSARFISISITTLWGKPSNLWTSWIYSLRPRVPSWIWIRWIQSPAHRNNFTSPPKLAMSTAMQNLAQTSSYFISGQHFLETFTLLSPNDQDHTFMDDYNDISHSHIQQCLHQRRTFHTGE